MSDFYSDALPSSGWFCLFLAETKEYIWADSFDGLKEAVKATAGRTDVYFAPQSFKKAGTKYKGRTQSEVSMLKCFRIDIDAGEVKLAKHGPEKVYTDGQTALKAFISFSNKTSLVCSYLIRSGTGLHVYYVLEKAITPEAWLPVARALQAFCIQHGLKVDPSVTTDSARVLRPLGSMHPCGKKVKILKRTGRHYSLTEFSSTVCNLEQSAGSKRESVPDEEGHADFEQIRHGCAVVGWASAPDNQNNVEEPLWRGLLGIVKFCTDASQLAHQVSECHSKYNSDETVQKLEDWRAGPTTCAYFAQYKPDLCSNCRHVVKVAA